MVSPPRLPAAGDGGDAAGRSPEAVNAGAAIRLTTSAQQYARASRLETALSQLRLGADAASGDLVSVEIEGERHDFSITRRRWIASSAATHLELTLDHPVRRGQ